MAWLTSTRCGPVQLEAVDEPNTSGGGWSSVFRLDLEGRGFYLKRQSNYLTRTLHSPLASRPLPASFAISACYRQMGIPALQAAFFGERKVPGERRAVLLTRALDGWNDLDSLLGAVAATECCPAAGDPVASAGNWRGMFTRRPGAWLFLPQAHFPAGRWRRVIARS
jgi:hypothetical protein